MNLKYKIDAIISTGDFSNIHPTFEVEDSEQEELAVEKIKELTNRFGKVALKDKISKSTSTEAKRIETFTGEVVFFDEIQHTYTDEAGNVLLSGSQYADQESPKFDMAMMLPKTAKAWEVGEEELRSVWKMNANISNYWGSAIHEALELAHKHWELGAKVKDKKELEYNYVLPKNPFLREVVESFKNEFGVIAHPEVVVSDIQSGRVGTIDRLVVTGNKVIIGDYKTNNEWDSKKEKKYQKQLSFYASILEKKGYEVESMQIYYLTPEFKWEVKEIEKIKVD